MTPAKGHDVLVDALAQVTDLPWLCTCVGSLDLDPGFVDRLRAQAQRRGARPAGSASPAPGPGAHLDAAYAGADLLVLASRAETYGMVVTEALARGLPVVATEVGGVPEALGRGADGTRPGLLVPPDDATALAAALRCWLDDPALRESLRLAARERRQTLTGWAETTARDLPGPDRGSGVRPGMTAEPPRRRDRMAGRQRKNGAGPINRACGPGCASRAAPRSSLSWSGGSAPGRSSTASA